VLVFEQPGDGAFRYGAFGCADRFAPGAEPCPARLGVLVFEQPGDGAFRYGAFGCADRFAPGTGVLAVEHGAFRCVRCSHAG